MRLSPGRGLDWFNGLVASVQTGFGPFIAVYLASEAWTQRDIGAALSLGTIVGMVCQVPGGAIVDASVNKRLVGFVCCCAIAGSAVMLALAPTRPAVFAAEVLHGLGSALLGPVIAALSLQMVGRGALGERLGRNARFSAIGSALAAAAMGAIGRYWDEEAVFYLTAALMGPALLALGQVRIGKAERAAAAARDGRAPDAPKVAWRVLLQPPLLLFTLCMMLFQLGNAGILPLVGARLTRTAGSQASLIIAACIMLPQFVVAFLSPTVGRLADRWGRRPVLLLALCALPLRAVGFAMVSAPVPVVLLQVLDGLAGAGIGILLPLVAADLTRGSNHFNLVIGALGVAGAAGATVSTLLAGAIADAYGLPSALLVLAGAGLASLAVMLAVPETRVQAVPSAGAAAGAA